MKSIIASVQVSIPFRMLIESYLDRFIEHGFNPEIGLDADALDHFSEQTFQDIATMFHKNDRRITLHGPFVDLAVGSSDPKVRELAEYRLSQMVSLLPVFKPATVVCHAGYDWRRNSYAPGEWRKRALDTWSRIGRALRHHGGRLMLENVYESTPDEMLPVLDGLTDAGVGFCFDPGHQHAFSDTPLMLWLERLGTRIGQIHLHDNNGDRDSHLAMGDGSIDLPRIFAFLKKQRLEPIMTLEAHREADIWTSLAYLEQHWPAGA